MSYYEEHQKMKPVLALARKLDIATNAAPEAIYEAGSGGFSIWCTPKNHPQNAGWESVKFFSGEFSKPCAYVASVLWGWEGEKITHLVLTTSAYSVKDVFYLSYADISNRPEDLEWAVERIGEIFDAACVKLLPIKVGE